MGLLVLMVLGFWAWWPIGLAVLAIIIGSRRMGCWSHCGDGRHHGEGGWDRHWNRHIGHWQSKMERMQDRMDRLRDRMERKRGSGGDWWGRPRTSGNRAFDDYRSETLRRLEEEQREFKEFLERLRFAKDRAEFDEFMSERRNRPHDDGRRDEGPQPQAT
ncbi:MAG: DUF2852 domain-containing protein [Xanthobacteraceae bacterium]